MPVMRPAVCLWLLFLAISPVSSQSLSPTVIASAGDTYYHASASISFTVGELAAIETVNAPEGIFTQGFQQPWEIITSIEPNTPVNGFLVYPNPTYGDFTVLIPEQVQGSVTIRLLDATGRILFEELYHNTASRYVQPKDVSQGLYWVQVMLQDPQGKISSGRTQKISIVK